MSPILIQAAAQVAYADDCESPADFRYGMERLHPEVGMDQIRALWVMALAGELSA